VLAVKIASIQLTQQLIQLAYHRVSSKMVTVSKVL